MNMQKPEWFDLENYEELKSFDLSDWYKQLNYRCGLKSYILSQMPLSDDAKKDFDRRLIAIQSGVVDIDSDINLDYILNHKKISVQELSAWDIFSKSSLLEREMPNKWNSEESFDALLVEKVGEMYKEDANIRIDLNASNAQIKKDFSDWLDNRGKPDNKYINKTNFKKENLENWIAWQLLPYIDLFLYFKAKNVEITEADCRKFLFPESSQKPENLTYQCDDGFRTITSRARWLMESSTISQIESQLNSNEKK